ncbi:tripartite-type tricarboxylate transporter receptor subunit TctC [Tibeticola sediminis]|uniref:Tripartite-type tricarboxylate transporter receptor subunit TctC n=1 Tax=Tibeticola sediminis TaxID=1917811 RepID=A0A3N4UAP9_9BURK|nr:tripartite-type tricarboxylate transporter receptor subunit TctC [Tibeticola sediminis]
MHHPNRSNHPARCLSRRSLLGALSGWSLLSLWATPATHAAPAEPWPSRPLRLLVGFPPGSSPDLLARALAEPLGRRLGQAVVVENRPGASGNLAAAALAQARDGHSFGILINGNLTIARQLNPQLPFDPARDFTPLSLLATAPLVLTAGRDTPALTGAAFLAEARRAGDRWNYGSPGVGTLAHLGMEWLQSRTGLRAVHIPYPGNPQVVSALLAGQIQLAMLPPGLAMAQAKTARLRPLAVTSSGRSTLAPEVPSLAEWGVRDLTLEIWNAAVAPAAMPQAYAQRLASALIDVARTPEIRATLFQQGWQVAATAPEGLAQRMRADTEVLARIIEREHIRLE